MGRATIVEEIGEGLYKVKLSYRMQDLDAELDELLKAKASQDATLLAAIATRDALKAGRDAAREALDEIVRLWIAGLLVSTAPPPEIEPSEPGGNALDEQGAALFEALNAARAANGAAELARSTALDDAAGAIARRMAVTKNASDYEFTAAQRCVQFGYGLDAEIPPVRAIAAGARSAATAANNMLRRDRQGVLSEGVTECGCAYLYKSGTPWAYFWVALLAAPGAVHDIEWPPKDPAKEKAGETENAINQVQPPTAEDDRPSELTSACGAFAIAVQQWKAAAAEVDRLRAERAGRDSRIRLLTSLKARAETPIWAWCSRWVEGVPLGTVVLTAETPNFFWSAPRSARTEMGVRGDDAFQRPNYTLTYQERDINIIGRSAIETGELVFSETLADGPFVVNLALEPGHLRWRRTWRYGTIVGVRVVNLLVDVALEGAWARTGSELGSELFVNLGDTTPEILVSVEIDYPCNVDWPIGSQVLVEWRVLGDARVPFVVGWRREPPKCKGGSLSWHEVLLD